MYVSRLNIVGQSETFAAAIRRIQRFAACDATVLIQGEIGTGKEVAARAIHYLGVRQGGPFTPINCGALPDSLFENELFGHVRGAFTDARDASAGLIASAESGTLFLDEVEALSAKGQAALLRFLQDGTYRPLGGKQLVKADVRVIAASNVPLRELTARGAFRADLMYRLAVMPLDLPPLRSRRGDIARLAAHFMHQFNLQYGSAKRLSAASSAALEAYAWPGNVRELENVLHREVLLCDGDVIEIDGRLSADETPVSDGHGHSEFERGFRHAKAWWIAEFERRFIEWALAECGGNVSAAARRAGKERRTFGRLVKKYAPALGRRRPGSAPAPIEIPVHSR